MQNQVIGIGSMQGWTRAQMMQELKEIQEAASAGGLSLEQWDSMRDSITKMYMCCSCEQFQTLLRYYGIHKGCRFEKQFMKDIYDYQPEV